MKILAKWKQLATACLFVLGTQAFADKFTTRSAPEIDPPAVSAATNVSVTGFTANWSAVSGATGYKLTVDNDANFSSPLTGFSDLDVGNVTTYAVTTPLTPDVPVYYRLKSYDSSEESTPSSSQQVVFATFKLIENFENAAVGDIADGGTVINGVTFRGSNAKTENDSTNSPDSYQTQIVSGKQSATALGKCISLWCYDDVRGNISWDSDGNPDLSGISTTPGKPTPIVSNVVIDLPKDTKLAKVALDVNRVSGSGNWWTSVQYSDDDKTTWKGVKSFGKTDRSYRIYNEDVSLTGVDAIRINVWRNGTTDPEEMLIDNIVLYESVPNYNLTYDFEGDDAQGWTVQSGSTFTDAVSAGNAYSASISGTYCLNTAYDGGSTLNNNLQGKVRSPIITIDSNSVGIIEFIQGGGKDVNNIGLAVYDADDDTMIARSMGEDQTTMFKRVVNVSDFKGEDIYIELYDTSTGKSGHAIVDNIRIQGAASTIIPGPTNFTATPNSATSMKLAWDAVSGASGYKVNAAINADFSTLVTGYPKNISGTSDDLTGLNADTTHYFSVVSVTGGKDSSPSYTNAKTFYNAGTTDRVDYHLETVFGGVNNRWITNYVKTTGAPVNFDNQTATSAGQWYVNQSVDYNVTVNTSNQFEIEIGTNDNWSGGKVWIDWNHDGQFDDATFAEWSNGTKRELVGYFADEDVNVNDSAFSDFKAVFPNGVVSQTVTVDVPASFPLNQTLPFKTRIRIRTVDTGNGPTPDQTNPDGTTAPGQLQDYGLSISDVPLKPPVPVWEATTGLSGAGFTLNWSNNPYAAGHYLTIATDSAFLNPIPGYGRKKLGAVFSETVSTSVPTAVPLYCKISAYNLDDNSDEQESPESEDLIILIEAPTSVDAGLAPSLNGTNQGFYIQSPDFDSSNLTDMTFMTWINIDPSVDAESTILGMRSNSGRRIAVYIRENFNRGTVVDVGYGTAEDDQRKDLVLWNGADLTLKNALEAEKATHLVISMSAANVTKIYLNGTVVHTQENYGLAAENPGFVGIGFTPQLNTHWNKSMFDEVAMWSRVLSDEEVSMQIHRKLTGTESGIMFAWNFNSSTAADITGNGYNGVATVVPTYVDSNAILVDSSAWAASSVSWNGNSDAVDAGGMALANVQGVLFDNTYVAYGPLKSGDSSDPGGADSPSDGDTDDKVVSPAPPADLQLTTRNLSNETDAKVRLKRLFELREEYVEATADIVFDKSQLSVIFGTTDTFRLVRRDTAGSGNFELVASTDSSKNSTTTDDSISPTDYAVGVEDNGYITFSSIALEDGFYTLASSGTGLTPAFEMDVTQVANKISWTVSDEVDVKEYRVLDSEGNIVAVVSVGGLYEVTLPNDQPATVVVVDLSGDMKVYSGGSSANYNLKSGWNLISIPLVHADITELESKVVGGVWGWTGSAYELVDSVDATDAVWVYVTSETVTAVSGVKSAAVLEDSLEIGWNMVGPTSDCNVPDKAVSVHAWKDVYSRLAKENDQLHAREGYWIFCTEEPAE